MEIAPASMFPEYEPNPGVVVLHHEHLDERWRGGVDGRGHGLLHTHRQALNEDNYDETYRSLETPSVEVYKQSIERKQKQRDKVVFAVRERQMKAHAQMMRVSGSTRQLCDQGDIQVGDIVNVRRSEILRRKVDEEADIGLFNAAINFDDGTPQYDNRLHEVVAKKQERGTFYYKLRGREKWFRKPHLCRFDRYKVGDIVRISNPNTIGQYRAWLAQDVQKKFRGIKGGQQWSSSLFMVTHLKDDPIPVPPQPVGATAKLTELIEDIGGTSQPPGVVNLGTGVPINPTPGISPGILLAPVWEAAVKYRSEPAVYGTNGLWWDSAQSLTRPAMGRPHSLGFYLKQQAKLAEDPFAIEPKDKFRGFKQEDLLRVDEQTQEAFWSRKLGDPKVLFVGVAGTKDGAKLLDEIEHTRKLGYTDRKMDHVVVETSAARAKIMESRAEAYSRCLNRYRKVVRKDFRGGKRAWKPTLGRERFKSKRTCLEHAGLALLVSTLRT